MDMMTRPPAAERPLIMGILNVTPDSFSDGGAYVSPGAAVTRAQAMVREGADVIDIGGESTRPGAAPVTPREQLSRVVDVIHAVGDALPPHVPISIDTTSGLVADTALAAGASWINDTSAGRDDPVMLDLAVSWGVPVVLMHRQGEPASMQDAPRYADVRSEVARFLAERAEAAMARGLRREDIMLDPGIGFGKGSHHNLELLAGLRDLSRLGFPLLLGASRKRFMGRFCPECRPRDLVPATCATTALGVMAGVRVFRVHDVAANRQAADTAWAIREAAGEHAPA